MRRLLAAVLLASTLLVASPAAAAPTTADDFATAALVDYTARVDAVTADRASRTNTSTDATVTAGTRLGVAADVDLAALNVVHLNASGGASKPAPRKVEASGRAGIVVRYALAQVGKSYRFGTAGPRSFDCSGLTLAAYSQVGIRLPHNSYQQGRYGYAISRSQVRAGDLVSYGSHVGIATSSTTMVAAATPRKGVVHQAIYGHPQFRRLIG